MFTLWRFKKEKRYLDSYFREEVPWITGINLSTADENNNNNINAENEYEWDAAAAAAADDDDEDAMSEAEYETTEEDDKVDDINEEKDYTWVEWLTKRSNSRTVSNHETKRY